jgi:hypothetical protein
LPCFTGGTDFKDIPWPAVGISAGEEVDILYRVHKRVKLVGDEESDKLGSVLNAMTW